MSRDSTDHEAVRQLLSNAEKYYSGVIAEIDPSKLVGRDRQAFHNCTDMFFSYRMEIINYLRKFQGDVRCVKKAVMDPDKPEDIKKAMLAEAFHTANPKYQNRTVFEQMHVELKASIVSLIKVLEELHALKRTIDLPKYKGIFRHAAMAVGGTVVCLIGLACLLIPGLQVLASVAVVQGISYSLAGVGALVSAFGFYKMRRARKPIAVDEELVLRLKSLVADLSKDIHVIQIASIEHEVSFESHDSGHRLSHCVPFDPTDLLMFLEFASSFEALWEAVIVYPKTSTLSPLQQRSELSAPASAADDAGGGTTNTTAEEQVDSSV